MNQRRNNLISDGAFNAEIYNVTVSHTTWYVMRHSKNNPQVQKKFAWDSQWFRAAFQDTFPVGDSDKFQSKTVFLDSYITRICGYVGLNCSPFYSGDSKLPAAPKPTWLNVLRQFFGLPNRDLRWYDIFLFPTYVTSAALNVVKVALTLPVSILKTVTEFPLTALRNWSAYRCKEAKDDAKNGWSFLYGLSSVLLFPIRAALSPINAAQDAYKFGKDMYPNSWKGYAAGLGLGLLSVLTTAVLWCVLPVLGLKFLASTVLPYVASHGGTLLAKGANFLMSALPKIGAHIATNAPAFVKALGLKISLPGLSSGLSGTFLLVGFGAGTLGIGLVKLRNELVFRAKSLQNPAFRRMLKTNIQNLVKSPLGKFLRIVSDPMQKIAELCSDGKEAFKDFRVRRKREASLKAAKLEAAKNVTVVTEPVPQAQVGSTNNAQMHKTVGIKSQDKSDNKMDKKKKTQERTVETGQPEASPVLDMTTRTNGSAYETGHTTFTGQPATQTDNLGQLVEEEGLSTGGLKFGSTNSFGNNV